jgi:RHS repeat-associated protein
VDVPLPEGTSLMIAAKHFDPILGIDIHLIITPAGVTVPIPHPYIGIVLDPMDWLPIIGASVKVNGLPRGQAGTAGKALPPHFPIGGVFAKPPSNESEIFMGSSTVLADGEPLSRLGLPVLSCQDIGMMAPPRPKKKSKTVSMVLPTSVVLSIPSGPPVLVGGPPTISLAAIGMRLGMAALGRFFKSSLGRRLLDRFQKFRQKLFKNLNPSFLKCNILRAEPVDITTGEVVVEQQDFSLAWPVPLQFTRRYRSHSSRVGVCGYGWETPADARLVREGDGSVCFRDGSAGATYFPQLPVEEGESISELLDGARLVRCGSELQVHKKEGLIYHFSLLDDSAPESLVSRVADRRGHSLSFVRSDAGLVGILCSAGPRVEVDSEHGRIRAMWLVTDDERRLLVRYSHDALGDLTTVMDPIGAPYTFRYEEHRMLQHTDRNGLSFSYVFDNHMPQPRVTSAFGDGGLYDYRFVYDESGREVQVTDSLQHTSVIRFDANHLPVEEADPLGGVTCFEYDDCGRTTAVVDPAGRRTEYAFDDAGNLTELTRPDGGKVALCYDERGQLISLMTPTGATWQQAWDERGLLVRQVSPTGSEQRFVYDSAGFLCAYVDELGARTEVKSDPCGHVRALVDPLGHTTSLSLDALGNVREERDPLGRVTRYRYDDKSRLLSVERPSGAQVRCGYDREDNLIEYTDEEGHTTRLSYFGLGEVAQREQPDGQRVSYSYDSEERLVAVTNQRGESYRLVRDPLGRIVEEIDYWGQSRRYTYNSGGQLVRSEDALGRVIDYDCDELGRLTKKRLPDGTIEEFGYDPSGNLISTKNPVCEVRRSYDAEGRLVRETQNDFSIQNSYDAAGRRTRRESSLGNVVEYRYDPLGRVAEICVNDGEPIQISRDAAGQAVEERLSSVLTRRYRYDADGQVRRQELLKEGSPLFAREYEYDRTGNLTRRRDSRTGVEQFLYDPMGRVREHLDPLGKVTHYLHDPAGDLQRSIPNAGSDDSWSRNCEYDGVKYRYDAAGNLVERTDRDGTVLRLFWDANNRLIRSRRGEGPDTTYGYDAQGRRIYKETQGQKTLFTWDADALHSDHPPNQSPREVVYYPNSMRPMIEIHHGSIKIAILSDFNGLPFLHISLHEHHRQSTKQETVPLRYQGQYYDSETSLSYNRNRYFDTRLNLFISHDPLGVFEGPNLYAYGLNTTSWIDPLGLSCTNLPSRRSAWKQMRERLKLGKTQQPVRSWTIHDPSRIRGPGIRHPDVRHQGRIHEFERIADNGKKEYVYIVDHNHDPFHGGRGHMHSAAPKPTATRVEPGDRYMETGSWIAYD